MAKKIRSTDSATRTNARKKTASSASPANPGTNPVGATARPIASKTAPGSGTATTASGAAVAGGPATRAVPLSREAIARRAYVIWERKGRPMGQDLANWQQAERELRKEMGLG